MNLINFFIKKSKNKTILKIKDNKFYLFNIKKNKNEKLILKDIIKTSNIEILKKELKKYKKVDVIFSPKEKIIDQIILNKNIKDEKIIHLYIQKYLNKKYKDFDNIEYIYYVEKNDNEEFVYYIEGYYQKEYYELKKIFNHYNQINYITFDNISINNFLKNHIQLKKFIVIYHNSNTLYILANKNNKLIFSRTIDISNYDKENNIQIIENIIKNIKYAKQKNPEISDIITIGEIGSDEISLNMIKSSINDIVFSSLNFFNQFENIELKDFNENLDALGPLHSTKYNLTPKKIINYKKNNILNNFILYFLSVILIFFVYSLYSENIKYKKEIKNQKELLVIKNDLKKQKLFDYYTIEKINNFSNFANKINNEFILNDFKYLKDLIKDFDNIEFQISKKQNTYAITANKYFSSLNNLNLKKKLLDNIDNKFKVETIIDFKKLNIQIIISLNSVNNNNTNGRRRGR